MDTDDQRREQIDQEVGRAVRRLIEENKVVDRDRLVAMLQLIQRDEAGTPREAVLARRAAGRLGQVTRRIGRKWGSLAGLPTSC